MHHPSLARPLAATVLLLLAVGQTTLPAEARAHAKAHAAAASTATGDVTNYMKVGARTLVMPTVSGWHYSRQLNPNGSKMLKIASPIDGGPFIIVAGIPGTVVDPLKLMQSIITSTGGGVGKDAPHVVSTGRMQVSGTSCPYYLATSESGIHGFNLFYTAMGVQVGFTYLAKTKASYDTYKPSFDGYVRGLKLR